MGNNFTSYVLNLEYGTTNLINTSTSLIGKKRFFKCLLLACVICFVKTNSLGLVSDFLSRLSTLSSDRCFFCREARPLIY